MFYSLDYCLQLLPLQSAAVVVAAAGAVVFNFFSIVFVVRWPERIHTLQKKPAQIYTHRPSAMHNKFTYFRCLAFTPFTIFFFC